MPNQEPSGLRPEFVQRLTASQSALYAFVVSLMGGTNDAHDVLQETNMKLCRKADQYDVEQPFLRWAYVFARFEVMAWRKRQQRSRLVYDDDLLGIMAAETEEVAPQFEPQLRALTRCIEELPPQHRELVSARYGRGEAVQDIAARTKHSENGLAALFYRLRKSLAVCITHRLEQEAAR